MTDALTQTEEEAALEMIVRNKLRIQELEAANSELLKFFKTNPDVYAAGTNKTVGKFYIRVSNNQRVDDTLAKAKLSPSLYKRLCKTVIDPTLAKRGLTPAVYDSIVKRYDNKIEVGLV